MSPTLGRFVGRDPLDYVDGSSMYSGYFIPNALDPSGAKRDCILKDSWWLEAPHIDSNATTFRFAGVQRHLRAGLGGIYLYEAVLLANVDVTFTAACTWWCKDPCDKEYFWDHDTAMRNQKLGHSGTGSILLVPNWGTPIFVGVRIIAKRTLVAFAKQHPDVRRPLQAWYAEAKGSRWNGPADLKERYATVSFLPRDRVVFNLGGNKYRLIIVMLYRKNTILIRFIGTHAEYDRINAEEI